MDPHLTIVAMELAHRRPTTDRSLLTFSALPDAPHSRRHPTQSAATTNDRDETAVLDRATASRIDPQRHMPAPDDSSAWDEAMPSMAHC